MSTRQLHLQSERVHVKVTDGAELSVIIYLPDTSGQFPCLLSYTPYRKGSGLGQAFTNFVEYGYAIVIFDVRGTGDSSGVCRSVYSDQERSDGYFMVEWCAQQPWCDGNVGMWGISYGAVVSLQMAQAAPPHLRAVIARSGTDDPYAEWTNPGGSPRNYIYEMYAPFMAARNFGPPDPAEWGDRWQEVWDERLNGNLPWGISFAENLRDGVFWRERAVRGKLKDVTCPVFVVGGWADWYPTPMLGIFSQLKGPRRALIGPWSHQWPQSALPGPRIDWEREALRWWDYWLKGIDTGIANEPPLTLFIREFSQPETCKLADSGSFEYEEDWPVSRAVETVLYLAPNSNLTQQASNELGQGGADTFRYMPMGGVSAGKHGGGPFRYNALMPLDQSADESHSLLYTTETLSDSITVIGRPRARLFLSSSQPIAQVLVRLCDVAPNGTSALITRGFLNLCARDGAGSPPTSLESGEIYEVEIELLACAYRVHAGHRLRLMISGTDFLNMWPPPHAFEACVYRGPQQASCILLPTVNGPALSRRPAIHVLSGDQGPELPPMRFVVGRDLINGTALYEFENPQHFANSGRFEVSLREPATASVTSVAHFTCQYNGMEFRVTAECKTTSKVEKFTHEALVTVYRDGKNIWTRTWTTDASREFF